MMPADPFTIRIFVADGDPEGIRLVDRMNWTGVGVAAVIPPKANRKAAISFDRDMYRWRHLIENTFAKLKEFRAVATRYDKTDTSYAASIHLAAAVIAS
jgi:transposase